jgi:cytochrome c554/c'-like protein
MHSLFNRLIPVLLILVLCSLFLFTSCEKEVEKIVQTTVTDTVLVYEPIAVDVVSGDVSAIDSVSQGGSAILTVTVTTASGGPFTYQWFATGGTFDATDSDTVTWKAPDDVGAYSVSVTVSDGSDAGVGTALVGVGMYAPTVTPYYLGNAACSGCHSGTFGDWEGTHHAGAWATLMESDHAASYCFPCHSVGYEGDFGNSGYDEAPIAKFENVQCENCHGPASTHTGSMSAADINIDYSAETCGVCHEGTHHPYLSEWEASPHAFTPDEHAAHGAVQNGGCQGCHEGFAALERLSDEAGLATFFGGAPYGTAARDTMEVKNQNIGCPVCHDSHDATNPGQIRTVADVQLVTANGESPIITIGGTGKLCMQCHHARRSGDDQVVNGYDHFGPHANPQADMMAGKSAYTGVAPAGFVWATPSHLNVQNSCKTCHLNMEEYDGTTAITGHTFLPTVAACENCHGTITSFDDILALEDFDGDGSVEGIQSEVGGLLHLLEEALVADGLDTTGTSILGALGDTLKSTFVQREAGYNLAFIEDDKSHGIHKQLIGSLLNSINYIMS